MTHLHFGTLEPAAPPEGPHMIARLICLVGVAVACTLGAGCGKTDSARPAPAPAPAALPIAAAPAKELDTPVRIVTWNVKEMFRPIQAEYRQTGLARFAEELQPDLLLLQEVVSREVVEKLRDAMKLPAPHLACSNFVHNTEDHAAFEVAIVSKFPLSEVIEYDPMPDGQSDGPPEQKLSPPGGLGLAPLDPAEPLRGFLWARIDALKLTVCVVHLKSSRGGAGAEDRKNAEKREWVMAAVAARVNDDRRRWPDYTCLVAGDFNVGCHDVSKNGRDLAIDDFGAETGLDRYDETHALLSDGLVGGLRMKNLALGIQEGTFVGGFEKAGPIDNIYVVGPAADRFAPASKSDRAYASDHYPVWTVLAPAG